MVANQNPWATLQALEALVLKRGVTLGRMSERDLLITLAYASLSIPLLAEQSETSANQALKEWLGGGGTMLRIDHVELRRSLIDMGYWVRDGFGRAYSRPVLADDHPAKAHVDAMSSADVSSLLREVRSKRDAERLQRQTKFQDQITAASERK
ncbi:hypothetical protein SAMN05216359_102552 [Roseateles sp. YR242]|uniref:DUF2087 domain-containing protein n=1 Tax=Roseateles sp. YR242 TaxID=1855305 RepID=UPI0008C80B35|nr:DUF2087 domain-containing protein [Roseateles sp. YR242]SEK65176.1 hypothetical protein SAMN05216359_102552 [Roseateles sp. YR242]